MSYDISLKNPVTHETIDMGMPLYIYGNTYCPDNSELYLNVTYNYRPYFLKVFGEGGIYNLTDMTAKDSIPLLADALSKLSKEDLIYSTDKWAPENGDVFNVIKNLLFLAFYALDGVWSIT